MNRRDRRAAKATTGAPRAQALLAESIRSLQRNDFTAAATAAEKALAADATLAEAHYLRGTAKQLKGEMAQAIASYRRAIALAPHLAEAHNNLGVALEAEGALAAAADAFQSACTARANYPEAHFNLANVLGKLGRNDDALAAYGRAIALKPSYPEALNNLSRLLAALGRHTEAMAAAARAVAANPALSQSHHNLGSALRHCGRLDGALAAFREAVRLRPDDAESFIALGNVLQLKGEHDEADAHYRQAHALKPLIKLAGFKATPDFRVLAITAPGGGNTPMDYMLGRGSYDSYFLMMMPGAAYDVAALGQACDVVVNLLSDADAGRDVLPLALDLVDRLDRPVINHPRTVLATARETIAARLHGIADVRIPKIARVAASGLTASAATDLMPGPGFPFLLRASGRHGGEALEKIEDEGAVATFAERHPARDYYVSEYVPYASKDGYFRKYRFIFVGEQVFPYHLAIADQWKVHHFRTDMANQEWMRQEEEAFVKEPATVFAPQHWQALRAIRAAVGLDYFGIDCALDPDGKLLVFEVNAAMLVHGENAAFAYKEPYIARIKQAFDEMLADVTKPSRR